MDLGQEEHVLGKRGQVSVAAGAEQHQPPLAGLDLLDIGHGLGVDAVPRHQPHHRHVAVDEGDRPVLEFAGGIALGVDVGDLLELERPFQGDGEVQAAADEEEVAGVVVAFDQPGDLGLQAGQFVLDDRGQVDQGRAQGLALGRGDGVAHLAEVQGEQEQGRQLAGEGLGRGHADLRAGMGVEDAVGLAGHGRADHVADGQHPRAELGGPADAGQGVRGLARLGDGNGQHPLVDQQPAVAELGGDVHLHRHPHPFLQPVLGHQGRVPGGAAGDQGDALDPPDGRVVQADLRQFHQAGVRYDAAAHGVADRLRLLEDLLEHEVAEAGLLGHGRAPVDGGYRFVKECAVVHTQNRVCAPAEHHHLAVVEEDHLAGEGQEGRDVRGDQAGVRGHAHDQRAVVAGRHELIRGPGPEHADGIRALDPGERGAHRGDQVAVEAVLDQMGDDLGVGLRGEHVAPGHEFAAQGAVVLDDAVVHHHQVAGAVGVRVGVGLGGCAVGGPAGVPQTDGAGHADVLVDHGLQVGEFAAGAVAHQPVVEPVDQPGRVVAAVLQPAQPLEQYRHDPPRPHIPHYSAH